MFRFPSPWWPEGCSDKQPRVSFVNNIFHFDRNSTGGFQIIQGCTYSCGLDYDKFEKFQGNLYWRVGGGLSADPHAFQVMSKAPANPAQCLSQSDPSALTFLNFAQWQETLKEDVEGTASVDPGFGKTHQPQDYVLSKNPLAGFDYNKTNDTIRNLSLIHI